MTSDKLNEGTTNILPDEKIPVGVFKRVSISHHDFFGRVFSIAIPYAWQRVDVHESKLSSERFQTIALFRPEGTGQMELEFSAIHCNEALKLFLWAANSLENIGYRIQSGRQILAGPDLQGKEDLVEIDAVCNIDGEEYSSKTIGFFFQGTGYLLQARCKSEKFSFVAQDFALMLLSLR